MTATYQDVLRANGAIASWAFTEASGLTFVPWIGGSNLVGLGTFAYRQTGPFTTAYGLHVNAAAKLTLTFAQIVVPPVAIGAWVRIPSLTLAGGNQIVWYSGLNSANGSGFYVQAANSHLHLLQGGVADTDLGFVWPNTNWHLLESNSDGTVYFDGAVLTRRTFAASLTPAPNVLTFGGDSGNLSANAIEFAYPAFYPQLLSALADYANFLGATDPVAALALTTTGAGVISNDVLKYVSQLYQNAP